MRQRKRTSGGQAIVMVTLALFSMAGMMGLAVDLGWSFFTQKAAQAAADDAALSAVQRAYNIIVSEETFVSTFVSTPCGFTTDVVCVPNPVSCNPANSILGNLQAGCLYARNDGFVPGGHGGRQNVLIESNVPPIYPTSIPSPHPGAPKDIVYWVTVRTNETIPQLFSALMGHTQGTISAVATAAIASRIQRDSFYGLNQKGDCFPVAGVTYCGVDFVGGNFTAPGGASIASICNGTGITNQCTGNSNYAGTGSLNGGPGVIDIPVANALDPGGSWTPNPTVTSTVGYQDPTQGEPQPPLAASAPVPSCGVKDGDIVSGATLGPFQYYHYSSLLGSSPLPDGQPVSIQGDVTFAANGTCPGGMLSATGTSQSSSAFPMYVFYGGLSAGANTVTFGAGQYVMAGVMSGTPYVFNTNQTNLITAGANPGSGNLFIFTNSNYQGLSPQSTSNLPQSSTIPNYNSSPLPALTFGGVHLNGGASDLFGVANNATTGSSSLPANLNGYGGMLFWQDRGNSTLVYDPNGRVADNTVPNPICAVATCTSAQMSIDGDVQGLNGVVYQPRGAWLKLNGTITNSQLQLLTGAVVGSGGSATLQASTNRLIRYLPALIQ